MFRDGGHDSIAPHARNAGVAARTHALGTAAIGATTSDVLADWTAASTTAAITCTTKMIVFEIDL